jgi:hypothetical protein
MVAAASKKVWPGRRVADPPGMRKPWTRANRRLIYEMDEEGGVGACVCVTVE